MTTDRERALRAADAIGLHEDSCPAVQRPDEECGCAALTTRQRVADALLAARIEGELRVMDATCLTPRVPCRKIQKRSDWCDSCTQAAAALTGQGEPPEGE